MQNDPSATHYRFARRRPHLKIHSVALPIHIEFANSSFACPRDFQQCLSQLFRICRRDSKCCREYSRFAAPSWTIWI